MSHLRAYAESAGFDRSWSLALEAILGGAVGALKRRSFEEPVRKDAEQRVQNESYSVKIAPSLMTDLHIEALRLGYQRYSDLLAEIIERFLGAWLKRKGKQDWTLYLAPAAFAELMLRLEGKKSRTWSDEVSALLKRGLSAVKRQKPLTGTGERRKRDRKDVFPQQGRVDQAVLVAYHEEAVRLGYERASDLYGEVLAEALGLGKAGKKTKP